MPHDHRFSPSQPTSSVSVAKETLPLSQPSTDPKALYSSPTFSYHTSLPPNIMSQLKYQMVAQVHAKLVKDAALPYSPLRKLVCQANMLDRLYLEYRAEVKQQQ